MAEVVIEKVNEQLNCSICLDTYTDPKILQCFHVYCQKCLVKLVMRDQQGQLSLSCPTCRQVTPVPAKGTAGLQSAFHINRLLEIVDQHREARDKAEREKSSNSDSDSILCSEHEERQVELFCETCTELLCMKCVIKGGSHHSHSYGDVHEVYERYKEVVAPSIESMEKQKEALFEVLEQLDRHCNEISQQKENIETKIRNGSKQLHQIIEKRQNELISQLDRITTRKLESLATQRDQIEALQAQLRSCLAFTRESLQVRTQQHVHVLLMKNGVLKQVSALTKASQPDVTFSTEADIIYTGSADAASVCEVYGQVYALDSPDPLKCTASGPGVKEAMVEQTTTGIINAVSYEGKPCTNASGSTSFEVELVSEITGCKISGSAEYRSEKGSQGQYVLSYQPITRGRHQLCIKTYGHHIRGSPFNVTVKLPVEKLGSPILMLSGLDKPCGIAVNSKGEVVVTEGNAHCVSVFSPSGVKLQSFGSYGSGGGQFDGPTGVAVDEKGVIIVADSHNHRIQKFTSDGRFLGTTGREKGSGAKQFNKPCGIAYCLIKGRVYVADTNNHRIQVLTSDLKFVSTFGRKGESKGQFYQPYSVSTDSAGRVYVADSNNDRIQVFTAEGKFLRMFGADGAERGELDWPNGIALDSNGLVYVTEINNHRVSVFTSMGSYVTSFGCYGAGPGEFDYPRELAVDESGVVYVCDGDNNRVQIF